MNFQVNLGFYVGFTRKYLPHTNWLEGTSTELRKALHLDAVEVSMDGGPTNILRLT